MSDALVIRIRQRADNGFALSLDLALPTTGITALFGPSGSGKTTVLDCIAGLRPDIEDADIAFRGESWHSAGERRPSWERGVGYVFQDARLFPQLSVAGNLDFAARRARAGAPQRAEVVDWLQIAPILERAPQTLSAGQAQRVAIARALLSGPQLLLLDEPLANLDRAAAAQCLDCLARVAAEAGMPMLFVSHRIEEVANIADRLVLLRDGAVEAEGPLPGLLTRLDSSLAEDENAATILLAEVADGERLFGLTELSADGETLYVASAAAPGTTQRVRIAARDVSVCRERPQHTSILNVLEVTLDSLRSVSGTHCLLRLKLREQFLLARITERSRHELGLRAGDTLFAQVKSSALLDERAAP
jgi:molybdate transport system ATP-binding protein